MPDPIDWEELLRGEEEGGTTGPTAGERWSAGISRGRIEQLQALEGVTVFDPTSKQWGIFKTRIDRRTGKRVYWLSAESGSGQAFNLGTSPVVIDPRDLRMYTFAPSGDYQSKIASQSDLERLGLSTTGGAGPQWRPGEQQMEQQALEIDRQRLQADIAATEQRLQEIRMQEAAADERQRRQLQAEREMLEVRLENSRRELVYSTGMAERRTLISEKAETGREVMRLGPDPFRQAAILGGGVQRGITPQQTVVGQAQAFMKQPLPEVSMNMDVAQLEQALSQMQKQGMTQPQMGGFGISSPGPFGMAGGGVIEMERGGDGAFSMKPKVSYFVGEGKHGEGIKAGTAEILTIGGGKVEVTPFGGGAQGGMEMSVLQGLSPLYTDFAKMPYPGREGLLTGVPRAAPTPLGLVSYGSRDPFSMHGLSALGAMGYQPSLMRFGGGPAVYYRDPTTGELQHVGSRNIFEGSGFNWQDVVQAGEGTRESFTFGSPLTSPLSAGQIQGEGGAFGSLGTILMEATTGAILPAIHKIARQLAQWKAAGDYRYDMALSAYGNALDPRTGLPIGGISPQYVDAIVSAATPRAGAFGGRRLGFRGGFL